MKITTTLCLDPDPVRQMRVSSTKDRDTEWSGGVVAEVSGNLIRNVCRTMLLTMLCLIILFSRPLFEGDNEFCLCLKESFPNLKTRKLTRVEWGTIRRLMGKPRRYAAVFKLCASTHHFHSSSFMSEFYMYVK